MRPGAWFAPLWVWQLLQSPVITAVDIARSLLFATTFAWIGNASCALVKKLPAAFAGDW